MRDPSVEFLTRRLADAILRDDAPTIRRLTILLDQALNGALAAARKVGGSDG
jgi:hypothetical protein